MWALLSTHIKSMRRFSKMTEIIVKDMQWLKEQVRRGVESYLQLLSDDLAQAASEFVSAQLMQSCCCEHADSDTEEGAEVRIVIEVPSPGDCPETFLRIGHGLLDRQ